MILFSLSSHHELCRMSPCSFCFRSTRYREQTLWRLYGFVVLMAVSGLFFVAPKTAAQTDVPSVDADLVTRLLVAAEADLKAQRLTTPKGNNAWDKYQRALALAPGHPLAVAGLERVLENILELSVAALQRGEFERAAAYLARIRKLDPDSPLLEQGERELAEARQAQAEREAELERQRQAELKRQLQEDLERESQAERDRQRQKELERQRQAELERERQAELKRQREAQLARQRAAEQKRQREAEQKRREAEARRLAGEMVTVRGGSFHMGRLTGRGEKNEKPVRKVTLSAFRMGKHEVTFAQWDACVADGGCGGYRPDDEGWGRGNRPVINVSLENVQSFIRWLNARTDGGYRLPTEAEWEYAARAGSATKYSWGDDIGENRANCYKCGSVWDYQQTAPVGSFAANAWGLHDMHGNVWEWTRDCWNDSYEGAPADGSAWQDGNCDQRVVRSGSWNTKARHLRSAYRTRAARANRYDYLGLRLVRER